MKPISTKVRVPNSLVLIKDAGLWDIPEHMRDSVIASTPSCIAVGCLPDVDGATEIRIGDAREMSLPTHLVFEGILQTPSRSVTIVVAPGEEILRLEVPQRETAVRVWTNGQVDTDIVAVGLE